MSSLTGNTPDSAVHGKGPIIVLAGAGASYPLGYETLYNFEKAIEDYAPVKTKYEQNELKKLFESVRRDIIAKGGDHTDFETILFKFSKYMDISREIRSDIFLKNEFHSTVSDQFHNSAFAQRISIGQTIVNKTILNHYGGQPPISNTRIIENSKKIYLFLKDLIEKNGGYLDYFTTNYDIGLESIWSLAEAELKVRAEDKIPIINGIEHPMDLSGDWNPKRLNIESGRRGLYIHRLHGCTALYSNKIKVSKNNNNNHRRIIAIKNGGSDTLDPCILFPGSKFHTGKEPFISAFRQFRTALGQAKCCVIIGCSFRDNNIVEYLVESNDRRRDKDDRLSLIVINTHDIAHRFAQRVQKVQEEAELHYEMNDWKIKFLKGSYIDDNNLSSLNGLLNDLRGIMATNLDKGS